MNILDTVWMVVCPTGPKGETGVVYAIAQSAAAVWEDIEQREVMGTGMTAAMLRKKGYRARQVQICLMDEGDAK
jgi:hypothetical protein